MCRSQVLNLINNSAFHTFKYKYEVTENIITNYHLIHNHDIKRRYKPLPPNRTKLVMPKRKKLLLLIKKSSIT